ncbi:DUF4124 domain-containing protein [Tahibacter caeni]|uniref:DUF4124 domain-containing protein n=1 Tax=Tahibacter caeni TaxID=1453545 RepID=UPI0021488FF4|nr:DUF4124 domain-containing protein [Tahibacter caeni]
MRLFVAAAALLLAADLHAAVYKCRNTSGAIEFKDKPCAPGTGGEIAVKGVPGADEVTARYAPDADADESTSSDGATARSGRTGRGRAAGDSSVLRGTWCEYAVSADLDGEKDESMPASWIFDGDALEYRMKRGGSTIKTRIQRDGASFRLDNEMLGGTQRSWEIAAQKGDTVVLRGPLGGYFHLRRGGCG